MRELLILAIHLVVIFAKLLRPGGARAVAAESLLLKHQLLISNRLTTRFVSPQRIPQLGALIKPATLLRFHRALIDPKYRLLFSSSTQRPKPGPKGPSPELIAAILKMKLRNSEFG